MKFLEFLTCFFSQIFPLINELMEGLGVTILQKGGLNMF